MAVHLGLLGPAAYVPASDPILAQRANEITNAAKESGRLEAAYLGVAAVARAFFINVPYHLAIGTYNAVNLFSDDPVLEHFRDALINLAFAAISVIYIAAGIIYSAAFEGFRIAMQQAQVVVEDPDLHVEEEVVVDHDVVPPQREEVLQNLADLEMRARQLADQVGGEDQLALQLVHQGPVKQEDLFQTYAEFINQLQATIRRNGVIGFQQHLDIAGRRFIIDFDFNRPNEHQRCIEICQQGLAFIERLPLAQAPLRLSSLDMHELPAPVFPIQPPIDHMVPFERAEILLDLEELEVQARELAGQGEGALQLIHHQGPNHREELLQMYVEIIKGLQEALRRDGVIGFQQHLDIAGKPLVINFDFRRPNEYHRCVELCQQGLTFIQRRLSIRDSSPKALQNELPALQYNGFVPLMLEGNPNQPMLQQVFMPHHFLRKDLPIIGIPRLLPCPVEEYPLIFSESLKTTPNWVAFTSYVEKHCPGMSSINAMEKASRGLQLIQKLHQGESVKRINLEDQLSDACWGLMLHAITKEQAFVEGTFDFVDPGHRFFHFFEPILYGRSSSHYKKRVIQFESGPWRGYGHFGLDIYRNGHNDLPASKRTVMLGRIVARDGSDHTYLKMENWGANLNFWSDPRALSNTHQVLCHTFEFFESQAKRNMPSVFGEVGGGLHMHKEHMLSADKKMCQRLYQEICKVTNVKGHFVDIDEYGFQDVIPVFREALNEPSIKAISQLHGEIESFLRHLEQRYDNLEYRKGDEVNLGASILMLDPKPPKEHYKSEMQELEESFDLIEEENDGFDILDFEEDSGPQDWEIARTKLMSSDYLSSHTVMNYASVLQKERPFTFVDAFFFPGLVEGAVENSSWKDYLSNQVQNSIEGHNDLIFVPLILESSPGYYLKALPWIGSGLANYCPDHIVMLAIDLKENTFEYYNSQGGDYTQDRRIVLGFKQSLADVAAYMKIAYESKSGRDFTPLHNPHAVQTDWSNCGTFACRFMKLRCTQPFEDICTNDPVNIQHERLFMAAALKRNYSPDPLQQANTPIDVAAFLEAQHLRMYQSPVQEILLDNTRPYSIEGKFNSEQLFAQIDIDLKRHHDGMSRFVLGEKVYDGTPGNDAQDIYNSLLKLGKKPEEILTWMSLLQQGIFASIEMNIWKDLEIVGPDSGFQVRGQGPFILQRQRERSHAIREYFIDITKPNPIIKATAYYELIASDIERVAIFREKPYAFLKATVEVNLNTNQTVLSWVVDEVIKN